MALDHTDAFDGIGTDLAEVRAEAVDAYVDLETYLIQREYNATHTIVFSAPSCQFEERVSVISPELKPLLLSLWTQQYYDAQSGRAAIANSIYTIKRIEILNRKLRYRIKM